MYLMYLIKVMIFYLILDCYYKKIGTITLDNLLRAAQKWVRGGKGSLKKGLLGFFFRKAYQ